MEIAERVSGKVPDTRSALMQLPIPVYNLSQINSDGAVLNKTAYMMIDIDLDDYKDRSGKWIGDNEAYLQGCNRRRGMN